LKFGRIDWNVPILPRELFSPYLSGLFDAEGHIQLRRNKSSGKKISQVIIYSINRKSLEQISGILNEQGVKSSLLERKRLDKPNLHYELRIDGSSNLKWFTEIVGKHSHLSRKKEFLNKQFLPRATLIAPRQKA
jgi:intein/homing endonuclease